MDSGTLYIVATPIGNLEDISARAREVLKAVSRIYAEDTRVTQGLLRHISVNTSVKSYHQQSPHAVQLEILNELNQGNKLALVSDAGTPGINDPGNELIDFLLEQNPDITIVPIPGPSAITAALSVCGFKVTPFSFYGYFPKKGKISFLKTLKASDHTKVYFDSPHRFIDNLSLLLEYFGHSQRVFVARELTKKFETLYRGTLEELASSFDTDTKGEIVVVIEGSN